MALIILDGWGYREAPAFNAIAHAKKPCWDQLWRQYPHTLLAGSGNCVGLPTGQMGNSEVGHMNIGAGRVIHQDLTRIDQAIADGSFFKNPELRQALQQVNAHHKALHILGLLSPGGVHSHEQHLHALLELAAKQQVKTVYLHLFLDGRDTPPRSAQASLNALLHKSQALGCGQIVSLIGRYYAMDRDNRWERTQKAYALLVAGEADFYAADPLSALEKAYARGENDEFVQATQIGPPHAGSIQEGDAVIFMNFRADRARQLTHAFVDPLFQGFPRKTCPRLSAFVTLTDYDKNLSTRVAFPPTPLEHNLPAYLSAAGLTQLRIAETEKYAHVTYFFNGGVEKPFAGEERILIPSPKVATYDLKPAMSAHELTTRLVHEIQQQKYDVIICNYANPDMVGHSGNFAATVEAIETIDSCLSSLLQALQAVQGEALITADHGNAELLFDESTQQPHTAHTHALVPALYVGRKATPTKAEGILADIAPTMLYLLGLPTPPEMTGEILFTLKE
jgi:2,3-bisphosphoglycerate-independent phosphoglycerate mutase